MFINYTNHPSIAWKEDQICAAKQYGEIVDIPFPGVVPEMDEAGISRLADREFEKLYSLKPDCVLCQGEFSLAYALIRKLRDAGIVVVAACTKRNVIMKDDIKMSEFKFTGFRKYI